MINRINKRLDKGNFSGCLFFLPCPKSATRPGISYKISKNRKQTIKLFLNFYKQG
nr:MAG TPA: hypothetical protein [Caudoviricetes sp.]